MIQGNNLSEPIYKFLIDASLAYVEKIEEFAAALQLDEPHLADLLHSLADGTAQSATLVLRFWPTKRGGAERAKLLVNPIELVADRRPS